MPVEKINGWIVLQHPLFEDQFNELQNLAIRKKSINAQKRLAAVVKLITEEIPADPTHRNFRLGQALARLIGIGSELNFLCNTDFSFGLTQSRK